MTNKSKTLIFTEKAIKVHGLAYHYYLVDYINSTTKVKIICPLHGLFEQIPANHLQGSGCRYCSLKNKKQCNPLTTEQFIEKAVKTHGNKYDYSLTEYYNSTSKVKILCPTHGVFEQSPVYHIQGSNCPLCHGMYKTTEGVLKIFKEIHGNKYSYPDFKLKRMHDKISIICDIHGKFKQSASKHKNGAGCYSCSRLNTGWTRTKFIAKCKENNNGLGIFYIIKCSNETETFYKFGITSNSIKKRYSGKKAMPYSFEIIQEITDTPINIFNYELFIKNTIDTMKIKYIPQLAFGGSLSECVKLN